jgi:hypothetical protein
MHAYLGHVCLAKDSKKKILKCQNIYYEKENSQTYPLTSNLCPKGYASL